jgi:uncharacterized protein
MTPQDKVFGPLYLLGADDVSDKEDALTGDPAQREELTKQIPGIVAWIYRFWQPYRQATASTYKRERPKTGRNDQCPCVAGRSLRNVVAHLGCCTDPFVTIDPMCSHDESVKDRETLKLHFSVNNAPDGMKEDLWSGYMGVFVRNTDSLPTVLKIVTATRFGAITTHMFAMSLARPTSLRPLMTHQSSDTQLNEKRHQ